MPVALDYKLQNKDRVKIMNDLKAFGPKLDWQEKVKTTKAKSL